MESTRTAWCKSLMRIEKDVLQMIDGNGGKFKIVKEMDRNMKRIALVFGTQRGE